MIEPAHDRVMVRPTEAAKESDGGLHIPEEARDTPDTGEVLGVGPKVTSCRVGDTVMYGKYTGDEHPIEGEDILFIRDLDVIGVEKGEAWPKLSEKEINEAAASLARLPVGSR